MFKVGLECEYFICNTEGQIVIPKFTRTDNWNVLAEIITEPHSNYQDLLFDFKKQQYKLLRECGKNNVEMMAITEAKLDRKLYEELRRTCDKGRIEEKSLYDIPIKFREKITTAGLHVHFSDEEVRSYRDENKILNELRYCHIFDFPTIIKALDNQYKDAIKRTNRTAGLYELKPHGFEYRSLPNDVDIENLCIFVFDMLHKLK